MRNFIINILLLFCLIGILYSGGKLIYRQYDLYSSKKSFENLQEKRKIIEKNRFKAPPSTEEVEPNEDESPSSLPVETEEKVVELTEEEKLAAIQAYLSSLKEMNEDAVAWLSIENTLISYPVMFTPKNPEYYLYKSFEKKNFSSGTPFLDYRTPLDSGNPGIFPIIYGHNMQNKTMFGELDDFINSKGYLKHPIILETMEGERSYQVFAAVRVNEFTPISDRLYGFVEFKNEKAFKKQIKFIKNSSYISPSVPVNYGDDILILSTCSYHDDRGRLAVIGVSHKKSEKEEGKDE